MKARSGAPNVKKMRISLNRFLELEGHDCLTFRDVEVLLKVKRHQPLGLESLAQRQRVNVPKLLPVISSLTTKGLVSMEDQKDQIVLTRLADQGLAIASVS